MRIHFLNRILRTEKNNKKSTWRLNWSWYSTTPSRDDLARSFQVTHPFHPLFGREFVLVTLRRSWGEERVYFHDEHGRDVSLPAHWTSAIEPDPFVRVSAGRSLFRVEDLLGLRRLIEALNGEEEGR